MRCGRLPYPGQRATAVVAVCVLLTLFSGTYGENPFEHVYDQAIEPPIQYHADHSPPRQGVWDLDALNQLGGIAVGLPGVTKECEAAVASMTTMQKLYAADATGKLQSGLLIFNPDNLGNYKECHDQRGLHYCLVNLQLNVTFQPVPTIRWGLCLPDACKEADVLAAGHLLIEAIIEEVHNKFPTFPIKSGEVYPSNPYCAVKPPLSTGAIVFIAITLMLATFVIIGTLWDAMPIYQRHVHACEAYLPLNINEPAMNVQSNDMTEPLITADQWNQPEAGQPPAPRHHPVKKFFDCFSLVKNIPRLLSRKAPIENLKVLNGMRTISMTWVLLGHTYLWAISAGIDNPLDVKNAVARFTMQPVSNGPFFAVDSFFYLSGFLVAYFVFEGFKKKPKLPLLKYYFHRFWRLTPTYMYALFLYSTLAPYFAEGPLWYNMNVVDNNCGKYWWTNMLYINNFYPDIIGDTSACMGWTWYLANDMQFYIVSPIFLLLLWKNKKLGLFACFFALCASWFITAYLSLHYHYDASMVHEAFTSTAGHAKEKTYLNWLYIKPYCRIGPYMVGLLTGWYLSVIVPRRKVYINRFILYAGWAVALFIMGSTVYGCYNILHGHVWSNFENMMYITFARTAWGLALAIVTIIGYMGHGGIITGFLGGTIWMPLGRLTYTAYLIHPVVMDTLYYGKDRLTHYEDHVMIYYFAGNLFLAYALASIVSMLVEFPTGGLEKLMFAPRRSKPDQRR